jgi:hypothetical protein
MRYFIISRNPDHEMADWWASAIAAKDTCTNIHAKALFDNAEAIGWHPGGVQAEELRLYSMAGSSPGNGTCR